MIETVDVLGVTKRYGATAALRGLTARFTTGLTIIEGPNGSGKSTLLGVVAQIVKPSSGTVVYGPKAGESVREQMGWLGHDLLCYADLTGRQSVELAAELAGLDPDETWQRATERFELGGFCERKIRTNSRGQKQRVALARAFSHAPSLVLLDEPTTGLDRRGIARHTGLLHEELKRELVLLLVTHEPDVFTDLPSRRLILDRGRVA